MSTKSTERKTDSCKAARTYQLNNLPLPLSAKNNHVDQAFYPVEGLNDFYRVPKVLEILRCSCDTCKIDREYFPKSIGAEACGEKVVQAGVRLFALLVHIGHPALILGFAQKAYNVIEQPSTISDHDLTDKYWATYHRKAPDDFRALVREFQSYKNQFEAPVLDGIYQELGPDAILPFANEKRIGNGSYGTVYRFDIPQYHCQNFPESSRPAWNHTIVRSGARQYKCVTYARKELSSERYEDFWRETENLLRVRDTLNGEHIVSILKAYRRGDKFSILFPYANMNLKQFLEERDTEHRGAPLELDELWLQVLGISEALSNIAERNDRGAQSLAANNAWFGCHFDLKPANILIFGNGVWKIADFGQAAFRARRGTDSNMTNEGGSDPYSAPETDIKEQSGPRYDVWSLGCIILEVTAFLVIGRSGLIGPDSLGMARTNTPPRAKGSNSRLWQRDVGDTFILKPKVEEFMQRLGTKLPPSTPSSRFLQSIIELIKEMLTPEASSRRDANGVVQEMRHIIATTKQGEAVLLSQSPMYDGEQRMGRDLLWDLR
jgi:serine/threonine protein kinase